MADVNASGDSLYTDLNQGIAIKNILKSKKQVVSLKKMQADGEKRPIFELDSRKWKIENQKGQKNMLIDNTEMHNVAYLFNCEDSSFKIQGKINTITVDTCNKSQMVVDDVVACLELINCNKIGIELKGKVPTIALDKCTGCQIYLNENALDVEVITSNSSEINVLVPKENGDYDEYPVPEMFKSTIEKGKGLKTACVKK